MLSLSPRKFHSVSGFVLGVILLSVSPPPFSGKRISPALRDAARRSLGNAESQGPADGQVPSAAAPAPKQGAHMDHKSKHGGSFFMALDNKHHLEGVLLPPGTFRVYLYDDRTKPLKAEETRQASGTVQIGESDDSPKIDLAPGKKKETLEVNLGNGIKFPVTLTLLLHLPGMEPDAKPELFNFTFGQFTDERGPGTCHPMANMPNMRC
jgi:hypothetical protein